MRTRKIVAGTLLAALLAAPALADEHEDMLKLQLTVVNLLESLVERGVLTREDANLLVAQAQSSAEEQAAIKAAAEPDIEDGDVRVTYVPEYVREQLREEMREELSADIVEDVKDDAREEGWGVPASLPSWIERVKIGGDLRVRAETFLFGADNAQNTYLDFQDINEAGGIDRAGFEGILNTTEDRSRMRGAFRITFDADLGGNFSAFARVTTGDISNPLSRNQTLGRYGQTWQTQVDRGYIAWRPIATGTVGQTAEFGRIFKPWPGTDIVWDNDLAFEGVYYATSFGFDPERRDIFKVGLGYFAINEVEFTTDDGYLASADIMARIGWGDSSSWYLSAAYHYFDNITGIRNAPESQLTDFTAPRRLRRGNTLFDIRNDLDPTTNLFALAAEYQLLNITTGFETRFPGGLPFTFTADYVVNEGYDQEDILARTGLDVRERNEGYAAYFLFGPMEPYAAHEWSLELGYRYLQRDAVIDAFTDSNFGGGATDTQGYSIRGRYGLTENTWVDLRWLSSSEIDGPPLTIDSIILDLNSRF